MSGEPTGEVTKLLAQIDAGDQSAQERLINLAYDELRAVASGMMKRERADHTLQPTALVHEAAVRLIGDGSLERIHNRGHFFAVMATAMRRILIDHARARNAERRGGDHQRKPLDATVDGVEATHRIDLLALDDALSLLESMSTRQCRIVELRFFGGFEMAEIAEQLNVSLSTIEKEWRSARAWLKTQLSDSE